MMNVYLFSTKYAAIMKRLFLYFSLFLFLPLKSYSQTGKVFDNLSLTSKILKSERKFAVYLPPDYDASENLQSACHGHFRINEGLI